MSLVWMRSKGFPVEATVRTLKDLTVPRHVRHWILTEVYGGDEASLVAAGITKMEPSPQKSVAAPPSAESPIASESGSNLCAIS